MAGKNIKGITIEIGGDATDLQKALQRPEKDARALSSELREINNSLKFNPDSLILLTQKSEVLGNEITVVSDKLRILKDSQAQVQQQAETGDLGAEQVRAFEREIEKTADQLNGLKLQLIDNGKEIQRVGEQTGKAAQGSQNYEKAIQAQRDAVDKAKVSSEEHGKSVRKIKDDYQEAEQGALSFSDAVKASAIGNFIANSLSKAADALWDFAMAGAEAARQFEVDQQRLTVAMRNTVNASQEQIDSVMQVIELEEQLGVVSKEAQTAAAQELATYVTKRGSLEKLLPVLNNMIVQQNGVNASSQSAISVATALGKTLDGQVGSLQRWGYRFTEAEQEILKGNNELKKLDVIANAVNASVGNMNYTLRETTEEGRMFAKMLDIGTVQQKFGKNVERIKNNLMISLLPALTSVTEAVNEFVEKNSNAIEAFGTIIATVANAFANLISIISMLPPELITVIGLILIAVKAYISMKKALTPTSEALEAAGKTMVQWSRSADALIVKVIAVVAALSLLLFIILAIKEGTEGAERAMNSLGNVKVPSVPNVRGYASGTKSAQRGLALVGEEGPELVQFRGGERVVPARQSAAMMSGGSSSGTTIGSQTAIYQITVQGLVELQEFLDFQDNQRRRGRALNGG